MRISGTWETPEAFVFHILFKRKLRDIIESDPDAIGANLLWLNDADFDRRLAIHEKGDKVIINEEFILKIAENYRAELKNLRPDEDLNPNLDKLIDFFVALSLNDTAYYERIGGIVTYIVSNATQFADKNGALSVHADYTKQIQNIWDWWKFNDKRDRTKPWINWGFRFIMHKYKSEKKLPQRKQFWRTSINICLIFIVANHKNWKVHEAYNPNNWFGKYKGSQIMALYGGDC